MTPSDQSACPRPDKLPFANEREARTTAKRLSKHVYRCRCGNWHLTSRRRMRPKRIYGKLLKVRGNGPGARP